MNISPNSISVTKYRYNQSDVLENKKNIIIENKKEQNETGTSDTINNFIELCMKFPDVSFVVVDKMGKVQPEYSGICSTAAFGDMGKVSIMIDEEILEKFEENRDYTVGYIQTIIDNYGNFQNNAKASGYNYTAVMLPYTGTTGFSYIQGMWSVPPAIYRETEKDFNIEMDSKYFQTFLMNIKNEVYDKLFEIGEDGKRHQVKSTQKGIKMYQENFIYKKTEDERDYKGY